MSEEKSFDKLFTIHAIFQESVVTTLNTYSEEESVKVKEFLIDLARNRTPYELIQEATIGDIVEHIFTVELHRDFIWRLIFNFYGVLGSDTSARTTILSALSMSLDVTDSDGEDSLVPDELKSRHLSAVTIEKYLTDNKWLVVTILFLLIYRRSFTKENPSLQTLIERNLSR